MNNKRIFNKYLFLILENDIHILMYKNLWVYL